MIVGPCSDGVAIMGYGTNSGIRGPDVAQRRISVVTELGDGPLSDVGFKRNFVLKVRHTFTSSELESLVA